MDSVRRFVRSAVDVLYDVFRLSRRNPLRPMRLLDLGAGSGVLDCALIAHVRDARRIAITGVDIDPHAIVMTARNIDDACARRRVQSSMVDLFVADWRDEATWTRLGGEPWDVIMLFNSPHSPDGMPAPEGYERTPASAFYGARRRRCATDADPSRSGTVRAARSLD